METAQESVKRREVRAPFDGTVEAITPHLGEWVKPGDTVIRLIRMDKLKAEGYVKVADYKPSQVMNHPVTVKVTIADQEFSFPGKIVYVDPEVQREREYLVRAEVDNLPDPQTQERLLRPGMPAKMEIQLK
jgi:multidrug resistance efflux pump